MKLLLLTALFCSAIAFSHGLKCFNCLVRPSNYTINETFYNFTFWKICRPALLVVLGFTHQMASGIDAVIVKHDQNSIIKLRVEGIDPRQTDRLTDRQTDRQTDWRVRNGHRTVRCKSTIDVLILSPCHFFRTLTRLGKQNMRKGALKISALLVIIHAWSPRQETCTQGLDVLQLIRRDV